jgi:hypothetical protein
MPWTIPNLVLHDKPVPLANMRSQGRNRVFICCCHHNAELNVSRLRDLRMLCRVCDRRGADVGPSWLVPLQFWFGWASHNK